MNMRYTCKRNTSDILQKESSPRNFHLWLYSSATQLFMKRKTKLTLHFHSYSCSWSRGGMIGPCWAGVVPLPISPIASSSSFLSASRSTLSRSSFPPCAILPSGAVTDGRPFLSHLSFNVNLGPISWRRALVGESNTYLVLALYLASDRDLRGGQKDDWMKIVKREKTNLWRRKNKKSRWLCSVTTWRPLNWGMGGNRDWKTLPTESPRRVVRPLRINSAMLVSIFLVNATGCVREWGDDRAWP